MADAVLSGATVNPQPDPDEIIEDDDHGPLAEGGGEEEDPDKARAATGTDNDDSGPEELHTAEDLNNDAKDD